jgi:hypothetical protein
MDGRLYPITRDRSFFFSSYTPYFIYQKEIDHSCTFFFFFFFFFFNFFLIPLFFTFCIKSFQNGFGRFIRSQTAGEWTIYPWIHSNCNSLSDSDQLRPVSLPDIHPARYPYCFLCYCLFFCFSFQKLCNL